MRWLFLFLLVLNVAYIAWQITIPSGPPDYSDINVQAKGQPILLLSEARQQQDASSHAAQDGNSNRSAPSGDSVSKAEKSTDNDKNEKLQVADRQPAETAQAGAGTTKSQLADIGSSTARQSDTRPQIVASASVQNDQCYTVGPFNDLKDLRVLTNELKPYVVNVDFRGNEAKGEPLYWVYIKPQKDQQTAIATGDRLKAYNVRDYFVIREGEMANGISLGYFRIKNSALGIQRKVTKLGFDVTVEPIYKTHTVYWLDYQVNNNSGKLDAVVNRYIASSKKRGIKRLVRACSN